MMYEFFNLKWDLSKLGQAVRIYYMKKKNFCGIFKNSYFEIVSLSKLVLPNA